METFTRVEETLLYSAYPQVAKRMSLTSILLSLLVASVGTVMIVFSMHMEEDSSTLRMSFFTLGPILLLAALYWMFSKSTVMVYTPTGSMISESSYYMDSCYLSELMDAMEQRRFGALTKVNFKPNGNGRLDYLISKDRQFVAVQLFHFVPYAYEPVSQVYYYVGDDAAAIARYLPNKEL